MKLSEIKLQLKEKATIAFQLPNGELVPSHFHVTEVGKITKHFIDCGGTIRTEEVANFQFSFGKPTIMTIACIQKNWLRLLNCLKKNYKFQILKLKSNTK